MGSTNLLDDFMFLYIFHFHIMDILDSGKYGLYFDYSISMCCSVINTSGSSSLYRICSVYQRNLNFCKQCVFLITQTKIQKHIYIYIYTYMCVCA